MRGTLDDYPTGAMVYVYFDTFSGSTGANITLTGLAVGDIKIYKDGSTTQRASTAGYTLLDTDGIDFDGITGIHGFSVDLSDNTTAGFYAAGHEYAIVVDAVTIDSQTVSFVAGQFAIERAGGTLALVKSGTYGLAALKTLLDAVAVPGSAMALTSSERTTLRDVITNDVIETAGSVTLQQALSIMLGVLAGVTTTGGATFKTADGSATRVQAVINASEERTSMTLSPSA